MIDPIVAENMLADDRDMLRMVDAVKRLAVLTVQPALAGIADWIRLTDTDLTLPQAAALRIMNWRRCSAATPATSSMPPAAAA